MLRHSKNQVFQNDVAILKKYTDDYFRITLFKSLRKKGFELADEYKEEKGTATKNTANNDQKLVESLSRTRSRIFEIAMCNDWEFYATLTLNKEYKDRYSLDTFRKQLTKWLNNYNSKHGTKIKYVLVIETHKDGAFHAHGFFMGIPLEHLEQLEIGDNLPFELLILIQRGREIYNWPAYADTFGFTTLEPIHNKEAVAKYITKYITKSIGDTHVGLNNHLYYCSKGLNRATEERRGYLTKELEADYSNDYIAVKVVRSIEEAYSYFDELQEDFNEHQSESFQGEVCHEN